MSDGNVGGQHCVFAALVTKKRWIAQLASIIYLILMGCTSKGSLLISRRFISLSSFHALRTRSGASDSWGHVMVSHTSSHTHTYTTINNTALDNTKLHNTTLNSTMQHCTTLHDDHDGLHNTLNTTQHDTTHRYRRLRNTTQHYRTLR